MTTVPQRGHKLIMLCSDLILYGGGGRWKKNTHDVNELQFASEQYAITDFTSRQTDETGK